MDKLREILNKVYAQGKDPLYCNYKESIYQARQAILDLVPGERIKQGKQNNSRFNHGVKGWNAFRDKLLENFGIKE